MLKAFTCKCTHKITPKILIIAYYFLRIVIVTGTIWRDHIVKSIDSIMLCNCLPEIYMTPPYTVPAWP